MNKIYVVPIEPLETRYTGQWYDHIPTLIETEAKNHKKDYEIVIVDGDNVPASTMPGAFLDFGATNIYKSAQLSAIANEFHTGKILPGDKFLFTDAWNPTVISLKYMSELCNIPVEIHGMWHAGSWDKHDFLGRLIENKNWIKFSELGMYECYDKNWFATDFHVDIFIEHFCNSQSMIEFNKRKNDALESGKISLTGWPMEYMRNTLKMYSNMTKKDQIVFPHRIAPEKQIEIFKDLANSMPEYNWVICQEQQLTKHQYHSMLGESKIVFSASLQETLGISVCSEGPLAGCIPLAPKRLSYIEIFKGYEKEFLYPKTWTENFDSYQENKDNIIEKIKYTMENYDNLLSTLNSYVSNNHDNFFSSSNLLKSLLS